MVQRPDGQTASSLRAGEPLTLVLRARNTSASPQHISLTSARSHDFSVTAPDGRELWRFSRGRMYAQVLGELAFAPGEEKEFRGSWQPPPAAAGAGLAAGRYVLRAWLEGPAGALEAAPVELRAE